MAFLGLDGQLRRLQLLTARIGASDTSTATMMTEFMVGAWASSNDGSSRGAARGGRWRGPGSYSGGATHGDGHGEEHERRGHVKELRKEQSTSQSLTRRGRRTKEDVDRDKAPLKHISLRSSIR